MDEKIVDRCYAFELCFYAFFCGFSIGKNRVFEVAYFGVLTLVCFLDFLGPRLFARAVNYLSEI